MKRAPRPTRTIVATAALVVVTGVAAVAYLRERPPAGQQHNAERLAAAPSRAGEHRRSPALVKAPDHLPTPEGAPSYGGPPVDRRQLQEARRQRAAHVSERFEQLMSQEPPDEAFASSLEEHLRSMTALPALAGARLEQLRCGATLCRASVAFADTAAQKRVQPVLEGAGRLTGGDAFVRAVDDAGGPRALVYFSRERPLPYEQALSL